MKYEESHAKGRKRTETIQYQCHHKIKRLLLYCSISSRGDLVSASFKHAYIFLNKNRLRIVFRAISI